VLRPLTGVHALRHIDVLHRPERTARRAVRTVLAELHRAATAIQDRQRGTPQPDAPAPARAPDPAPDDHASDHA
jgi:hypothetical protein